MIIMLTFRTENLILFEDIISEIGSVLLFKFVVVSTTSVFDSVRDVINQES